MPQHRSLTLEKLVKAIDPSLLERYFTEKLRGRGDLPFRIIMDWPAIDYRLAPWLVNKMKIFRERKFYVAELLTEDIPATDA